MLCSFAKCASLREVSGAMLGLSGKTKHFLNLFPGSWNEYDSLGEAYLKAGKKELAIENYKNSLELNPKNANAQKLIES